MTEEYIKQEGSEPEWVPPKRSVGWWIIHGVPAFIRVCVVSVVAGYGSLVLMFHMNWENFCSGGDLSLFIWLTFSLYAWLVDYIVLLIGFRNPKRQLLYGIGLLLFHIGLYLWFIICNIHTDDIAIIIIMVFMGIWTIPRLIALILPLIIIKNYAVLTAHNADSIKESMQQRIDDMINTTLPFKTFHVQYEFEIDGIQYKDPQHYPIRILAHKFEDYKERGKPLRVIYSKTNPKYNMILQD